ncbi:MAG: alpha/beta hydrolase [Candidatus Gracilibacteria bacterium]|nr:alpha/beta hydrolase [Candidatus Gracilibacteria bacterium]
MKTAIIIHGMPYKEDYYGTKGDSESNCHWFPWLQKQLIVNDILAQTPEMPKPYLPEYEDWKRYLEMWNINEDTILVGHSLGAGFIAKWLSENDVKVGKVALVAPWINTGREIDFDFFTDFEIDKNIIQKTKGLKIFASNDDMDIIKYSIDKLIEKIPNIDIKYFDNMGHFNLKSMNTREFPELLEFLLG